ncbi:MAG: isopentenyldiphosphate isomerase [Pseudohongiellaceae bacterium]
MSLLDRIRECNAHDPNRYRPFVVDGTILGAIREEFLPAMAAHREVLVVEQHSVTLHPQHTTIDERSAALDAAVADLSQQGVVRWLGSELYPLVDQFGGEPFLRIERSALPTFGARAFGVHMHGIVRRPDGLHLWIARRAKGKTTHPGKLDNMVAGGQPLGLTVAENLIKECGEEADIPPELAKQAVPTGCVSYRLDIDRGLRHDTLFLFDLEVPEDFVPRPVDGEVESFELLHVDDVREIVAQTNEFKFNCNLAIIDLLLRHGIVRPDHRDYTALVAGLHAAPSGPGASQP